VVASKIGGLPEVVEHEQTGLHTIPGDVESLCEALRIYITSPILRVKHGKAARDKVERVFNWNDNAQKMDNVYRRILTSDIMIRDEN
jgi:type III pantothenate kinase